MSDDTTDCRCGDTVSDWGRLNDDIADCLRRLADLAVAARAMAQSVHILGDPDEPGWFDAMRFDPRHGRGVDALTGHRVAQRLRGVLDLTPPGGAHWKL